MAGFESFDDSVASAAGSPAGVSADTERAQQNYTNPTTPNPSQLVSDHSAEGAAYLPAARAIPENPPAPGMWTASHDVPGAYPSYDANSNQRGNNSEPHDGKDGKHAYGLLNIGNPFLAAYSGIRHLRTSNQFDPQTGKNVNPADAPSAPVQMWNSQHNTAPRWIGFDVAPLFENVGQGPRFSTNPGYLGVSDNPPNRAPRQWGSEVAQAPDDPYVYQGATAGPGSVDYSWDF